jgi:hypothetical protein
MKSSIFWDIELLKVNGRFGGTCRLHLQGQRISQARNKREAGRNMEAICSSETPADFQRTTRPYNPGDRTLRILRSLLSLLELIITECKSVKISHTKFQQNLWKGLLGIWKSLFKAMQTIAYCGFTG